jgi:hypothetical protein
MSNVDALPNEKKEVRFELEPVYGCAAFAISVYAWQTKSGKWKSNGFQPHDDD